MLNQHAQLDAQADVFKLAVIASHEFAFDVPVTITPKPCAVSIQDMGNDDCHKLYAVVTDYTGETFNGRDVHFVAVMLGNKLQAMKDARRWANANGFVEIE